MYAGIAKLNSDWLLHAEPMASKLAAESLRHDATLRGLLCRHDVAVAVCSRVAGVGARVRPGRRAASGHRSLGGRSPLRSAGRVCHRPATVDLADLPLPLNPNPNQVSLCGVVVDLALPVLLLWPRGNQGRRVGLMLASLFHATNLLLWQARRPRR